MKSTSGNLLAAILALLCAGAAGADNKPGEFALVENGKAMAEIVLPEKADAVSSFAAEELAAFTGKITQKRDITVLEKDTSLLRVFQVCRNLADLEQ